MADRRDPFAKLTDNAFEEENQRLVNMFGKSFAQPKPKRDSSEWNKAHPVFAYLVSEPRVTSAKILQGEIKIAAWYDQDGKPREDLTTVSQIATIFLEYGLKKATEENISFAPAPKGRMKLTWREADESWEPAVMPKLKPKKKKVGERKQFKLAYRWTQEHHQAIQHLAGDTAPGTNSRNPNRYLVPLGEVVFKLLQRGATAYKKRILVPEFRIEVVQKTTLGWTEK